MIESRGEQPGHPADEFEIPTLTEGLDSFIASTVSLDKLDRSRYSVEAVSQALGAQLLEEFRTQRYMPELTIWSQAMGLLSHTKPYAMNVYPLGGYDGGDASNYPVAITWRFQKDVERAGKDLSLVAEIKYEDTVFRSARYFDFDGKEIPGDPKTEEILRACDLLKNSAFAPEAQIALGTGAPESLLDVPTDKESWHSRRRTIGRAVLEQAFTRTMLERLNNHEGFLSAVLRAKEIGSDATSEPLIPVIELAMPYDGTVEFTPSRIEHILERMARRLRKEVSELDVAEINNGLRAEVLLTVSEKYKLFQTVLDVATDDVAVPKN